MGLSSRGDGDLTRPAELSSCGVERPTRGRAVPRNRACEPGGCRCVGGLVASATVWAVTYLETVDDRIIRDKMLSPRRREASREIFCCLKAFPGFHEHGAHSQSEHGVQMATGFEQRNLLSAAL